MLFAFGVLNDPFLSGKFEYGEIISGILDAQLFFAMLIGGISLAQMKYPIWAKCLPPFKDNKTGVKVGWWIIIVSLPFELAVAFLKIYISIKMGYAALYQDVAYDMIPSSFKILSYFFLPGVWYLYFCSKPNSRNEKISKILLIWVCISYLLMGYRAISLIPVLLYIYSSRIKNKYYCNESNLTFTKPKSKKVLFGIIALMVLFVFPAVRATRNSGGLETAEKSDFFKDNEVFATISDMGKSLQTYLFTKQYIPEKDEHRLGMTYLMDASTMIPNFFWDKHPSEVYGSLGRWITLKVAPEFYAMGGSLGYSFLAESYANLGLIGIILIPFMFGYFLKYMENRAILANSPIGYASIVIVAFYLLSYPRGEFSGIVRGIAWYMLIPYIFYKSISKKSYDKI